MCLAASSEVSTLAVFTLSHTLTHLKMEAGICTVWDEPEGEKKKF